MTEDKTVTLTQPPHEELRGSLKVFGDQKQAPLVHMVCWNEEEVCRVEHGGSVTLRGDAQSPLQVRMGHHFDNVHQQSLKVETKLAEPIHHALQLRTPLQVRFCNPWHVTSDYQIDINLGNSRLIGIRLTGATVLTPQPCEEDKNC